MPGCLVPGLTTTLSLEREEDTVDAITLLKDDHQRVEKLFKECEKAGLPDRAGTMALVGW
jgi:hypothetical protein